MDQRLTRWLLATILAVFLLLLSLPVARLGRAPGLVERAILLVAGGIATGVEAVGDTVDLVGETVRTRRQLEHDNRALRDRLDDLEFDNARLNAAAARLRVLEGAQGFVRASQFNLTPAEVVFHDSASATSSWVVRVPAASWRLGQPVLSPAGVVGRVALGSGRYARVRSLTDYDHAMGAMIDRTRRQGVVRGSGGSRLTLNYIPRGSDVRLGDQVVTSGTDGVFPRGLTIGEVVSVDQSDDLLLQIGVRPSVDFGTLEVVFLLTGEDGIPDSMLDPSSEASEGGPR